MKKKYKYKFSIIIPIYNAVEKINNCISSLQLQSFKNFEIIFVDDCSNDNSYNYLKELSNNSKLNIKLFCNEKNSGPGYSRNVGLTNSSGEFILFMDADDYIKVDALNQINKLLNNFKDVDCILFDYFLKSGNNIKKHKSLNMEITNELINVNDALLYSNGSVWGKLFSSKIINKIDIRFPLLMRNEDMPFTKVYLSFCENIYYCDEAYYYYVMYDSSLMHNKAFIDERNAVSAFEFIGDNINNNIRFDLESLFIREVLYSNIVSMISKKYSNSDFNNKISKIENMYPIWYKNDSINKFPLYCRLILLNYHKNRFLILHLLIFLRNKLKK